MEILKREIKLTPAWDKRSSNPTTNYGIHGVDLQFFLSGVEGVIQFIVYTNWQLPEVQKEIDTRPPDPRDPYLLHKPRATDIGYHSYIPRYEGQTARECKLLNGANCYYDGSSLSAETGLEILRSEGDEGVWKWMEDWYVKTLKAEAGT